jgi:3-oxoacyl-[acyl-carrier protein] reductase
VKLQGKVAVVVGGASGGADGVGGATSRLLAQEGARVMIADVNLEAAEGVAAEIRANGGDVATVKVDMTRPEEAHAMARATLERFGQIDILANIAGGSMGRFIRDKLRPFAESTDEEWFRILDINLNGARNCTRAVVNHMIERRTGKIVSFSTIAALRGMKNGVDYAAAKAGILAFTKSLALELEPYGIQVNCISPGGVDSARTRASVEEFNKGSRQPIDLNKYAKPDELARVVLFLVSDDAPHVMGENIVVAGVT